MPRSNLWRLLAALTLALGLPATAPAAEMVSRTVAVTGAVKAPLTLTREALMAFPADQIASATVTRRVDGKELPSTVRGVRLTAVLDKATFAETNANDWKHAVVLATATDGYAVVFSWPELVNSEAGNTVLLVFERDGQPLAEREGEIAMVSARDLRTGPRSVRWLKQLDVRILQP